MNRCIDLDRLVAFGAALDWQVDGSIEHLLNCADCREQLRMLTSVHGAISAEEAPRPGLVDDVMAGLPASGTRRASMPRMLSVSLTPLLSGVTAFFAIAMAATAASPVRIGPAAIGAALVMTIGTAWWNGRTVMAGPEPL